MTKLFFYLKVTSLSVTVTRGITRREQLVFQCQVTSLYQEAAAQEATQAPHSRGISKTKTNKELTSYQGLV